MKRFRSSDPAIEIKAVPKAGQRQLFDAVNASFGEFGTDEQFELDQKLLDPARTLGAYDGETIVGGASAFTFRMTVPGGGPIPTAGVTSVGVMPTHRRQGILRQLMARQLADAKALGEPLAALWASEGSIYQRFGYGLASLNGSVEIERERAAFRDTVGPSGSFRLVDAEQAKQLIPPVHAAVVRATPGFFERNATWWDVLLSDPEFRRRGAGQRFNVVFERDGSVAGYLLYRIRGEWTDLGHASTLVVLELQGLDADAIRQLWRYAFGVDLMARIKSRLGPPDHPLLLMVAEPRRLALRVGDGLWLRILDVPAALEARSYAADGAVVLDVSDAFMPDVRGRWRLSTSGGRGRVEASTDPPDLLLDITDLGAIYLGGFTLAQLARAGRTKEATPGARARADDIFRSDVAPWCPEIF